MSDLSSIAARMEVPSMSCVTGAREPLGELDRASDALNSVSEDAFCGDRHGGRSGGRPDAGGVAGFAPACRLHGALEHRLWRAGRGRRGDLRGYRPLARPRSRRRAQGAGDAARNGRRRLRRDRRGEGRGGGDGAAQAYGTGDHGARARRAAMLLPRRPRARALGLEARAPFPKGHVRGAGRLVAAGCGARSAADVARRGWKGR